jgi:hypothetical protein
MVALASHHLSMAGVRPASYLFDYSVYRSTISKHLARHHYPLAEWN